MGIIISKIFSPYRRLFGLSTTVPNKQKFPSTDYKRVVLIQMTNCYRTSINYFISKKKKNLKCLFEMDTTCN